MREIKFRCWDIVFNKMRYEQDLWDIPYNELFIHTPDQRSLNLMQYTGLKDINEVEIYEGDIFECSEGNLYEVLFHQNHLRFEAMELYMKNSFELNDFICAGSNHDDILDGHIVGNKFENEKLYDIESIF